MSVNLLQGAAFVFVDEKHHTGIMGHESKGLWKTVAFDVRVACTVVKTILYGDEKCGDWRKLFGHSRNTVQFTELMWAN